ncbi:MAG TPA: thioredoxin domain-containing protein [Pyrinomonadaceae bacterium]|jgi:protein-disulfide isomerase
MSENDPDNSDRPQLNHAVILKNTVTAQDHAAGPKEAPVTLLEYGNFECIDCGRAHPVIKEVQRLLGDNLRFVFRHFPNVRTHPHALRAAEASEAAAAQGKFWEMHDELFTHQKALADPDLLQYARRIRLDAERFARDMTGNNFLKNIEAEYNRSLFDEHVTGTPTFYVNEVRYTGRSNVESLLAAIKEADVDGRIRLPERAGRIRNVLGRLRRSSNA